MYRPSVVQEAAGSPIISLKAGGNMAGAKNGQEVFLERCLDGVRMQLFPRALPEMRVGQVDQDPLFVIARLPPKADMASVVV
jgi:hypothetical protein